jgi:hypothetical protein
MKKSKSPKNRSRSRCTKPTSGCRSTGADRPASAIRSAVTSKTSFKGATVIHAVMSAGKYYAEVVVGSLTSQPPI